jgi:hypothetical protein
MTRILTRLLSRLLPGVLFFLSGCTRKPLTDADLAKSFFTNREWFGEVSSSYNNNHITCSNRTDPDICVISDAQSAITRLRGDARVQSVYVKRNHDGDNGLWMPVQTYGVMSTSSSTRGYIYLKNAPKVTVGDTLAADRKGTYYRALSGQWYLFVSN